MNILILLLTGLAYLGFLSVYVFSIYEAISINGWKGAFTVIPVFGQIIWAGVKFFAAGLFNTYFYLIYGSLGAFGLANLLAAVVPKDDSE